MPTLNMHTLYLNINEAVISIKSPLNLLKWTPKKRHYKPTNLKRGVLSSPKHMNYERSKNMYCKYLGVIFKDPLDKL